MDQVKTKYRINKAFDAGDYLMPQLDDDMVMEILTCKDDLDVICKFGTTCTRWRRICKSLAADYLDARAEMIERIMTNADYDTIVPKSNSRAFMYHLTTLYLDRIKPAAVNVGRIYKETDPMTVYDHINYTLHNNTEEWSLRQVAEGMLMHMHSYRGSLEELQRAVNTLQPRIPFKLEVMLVGGRNFVMRVIVHPH
jgi:hypothetical protein